MRAALLEAFGDASNFRLGEAPRPQAGPGQVLVRIAAASVNPVDCKLRASGRAIAPELPAIMGCDMAGIVEEVGPGVAAFRPGDRVYGCAGGLRGHGGSYAEYMSADARLLAPVPRTLTLRQAAALPLVSITAWEALYDRARVQAGETVLIHGGTGGVGHIGVQLAKARGARVVATASSAAKAALARTLGADEVVDYRNEAPEQYVQRITEGRGFAVVFDATGNADLAAPLAAAALQGRVVTIVARSGDLTPLHAKGLSLHAVYMLIPLLHDIGRERHGAILRSLAELVDGGQVRPLIDERRFTLAELGEAQRHLESGQAVGKVVIDVADSEL